VLVTRKNSKYARQRKKEHIKREILSKPKRNKIGEMKSGRFFVKYIFRDENKKKAKKKSKGNMPRFFCRLLGTGKIT